MSEIKVGDIVQVITPSFYYGRTGVVLNKEIGLLQLQLDLDEPSFTVFF